MSAEDPLQQVHLFEPLDDAQLARMRESMREFHLAPGDTLFTQGDPARYFFLICVGSVKLFLLSREGEEKVIDVLHAGAMFAEAVMFMEHRNYPVNAGALTETRLLAFDNEVFLGLLRESPDLTLQLLGTMSRRLHQMVREIDELSLHNANYRFITYLLQQERTGANRVDLNAPKQVIASRLSMKPETLSRTLSKLRDQGLIRVKGDSITFLDEPGIRRLLES
ncbi:Crp/Fnr family transcriptional regulator [Thioalkalivibrio paradoxus]|uniref:Crp/Fnr family transcriptional regulator n=1 Tax=Thioalkalivibrio paradoxus ARh 1 TaxID=713585 RepID=W0DJJ6_9GAMM|nr:Crp/Fnr family transcriptional regulator [Thioalkalivibrio paradoxus]AHE98621.1 Crp/Fnr family transcriptional regulator [Thioalkalivibrio paradoxus ARh 1]